MADSKPSLADAKMLKDILKYHVICDLTGYVWNEENALPYILRKEVSGDLRIKSVLYSMDCFKCFA